MGLQRTQLDVLGAVADIQEKAAIDTVEEGQIAEEVSLDINLVRETLDRLAEAGYVQIEKIESLSGKKYMVSLTSEGQVALLSA